VTEDKEYREIEDRLEGHIQRERAAKQFRESLSPEADAEPKIESGDAILRDVENFIGRFSVHPSEHARVAHVLWVGHTHLMDNWDSTPRLAFLSPEPASGKTRALEVTELLVPSPVNAVNVSPAYLFRKLGEQGNCTILFDEIDTVFGPKAKENEEIRGLLNAGHRRGAVAGRCVTRGKEVFTEEIPAYCAVALAGIGWLPDTILSRSVLIRMQRRKPGEAVEPFRRRKEVGAGHKLRDRLARWASRVGQTVELPDTMPVGVEDRDADVWEALLAVANAAGGDWPERAKAAAKALIKEAHDVEPSLGIRLLADLKTVFGDAAQNVTTDAILHALHTMPESPWNDLRGKPLNDRGLATRLRQYGIKPKVIRVGGATPRGYSRQDFHDAWLAYLPPLAPDGSATSATGATSGEKPSPFKAEGVADAGEAKRNSAATSATSQANVADGVADVADGVADKQEKKVSKDNDVADVADVALPPEADPQSICAHCGQPGGLLTACDGRYALVHPHCSQSWFTAQEARRNQRLRLVAGSS
jgi:hypothetical protein